MRQSISHNWHVLTERASQSSQAAKEQNGEEERDCVLIRSVLQTVPVPHLGSVALSLALIMH